MKLITSLKVILAFSLVSTTLYGNDFSPLGNFNSELTKNNLSKNKDKTYSELISALKESPSGEHAMFLGLIYLNGLSEPDKNGEIVSPNTKLAIKALEKSIDLEYFKSAAILGSLYLFDDRLSFEKENIKKAKYYLELALNKEVYEASMALSSLYMYYEHDKDKTMKTINIGVMHKIATTELALATMYAYGSPDLNISKDLFLANELLGKACSNPNKTKEVTKFCTSNKVTGEIK